MSFNHLHKQTGKASAKIEKCSRNRELFFFFIFCFFYGLHLCGVHLYLGCHLCDHA